MFGVNTAAFIKVVVVIGLAALGGGYAWGRLDGAAMTQGAVERALSEARQSTENAINELADEADRARVRRHMCVHDRGGVWSFANNVCIETEAQS